jgi:hypothetical protein
MNVTVTPAQRQLVEKVVAATKQVPVAAPEQQLLFAKQQFGAAVAALRDWDKPYMRLEPIQAASAAATLGAAALLVATGGPSLPANDALLAIGHLDHAVAVFGEESLGGEDIRVSVDAAMPYLTGLAR